MQKKKPVKNLSELRYKMAEKFADLENGDISVNEAKAFSGMASVIVNSLKVEMINNQINGVTSAIDFLGEDAKKDKGLSLAEAAVK